MKTADEVAEHLRDELLVAIETQATTYLDEEWRSGITGAMLDSRINVLHDLLELIIEIIPVP